MQANQTNDFALWTSLLMYFAAWFFAPLVLYSWVHHGTCLKLFDLDWQCLNQLGLGEDWRGWKIGLIGAVVYVGGHVSAIGDGHCFVSADGIAIPTTVLAYLIFFIVSESFTGIRGALALLAYFSFGFTFGHLLAFSYYCLVSKLLGD